MSESELAARVAELEAQLGRRHELGAIPYRTIVEDMSELVVRWRPDGTRLFVNDAYCRLFGARREDLIGTSFWPLITDEDRREVQGRIDALSVESPVSTGRHHALGIGGNVIWMEWVDRAIYDEHGRLIELQSVGRDITERVLLEEQGRRIARGDATARASAAIAHDLRNLLLVIGGVTSLMGEDPVDSSHLDVMREAVHTANRLLTQLSNVSHGVVVDPQAVDLSERVSSLRGLLKEVTRRTVQLEERLHPGPCRIVGDPTQIDQILLNLVRNAVDAMPQGGTIRLETAVTPASELPEPYRPPEAARCTLLRVVDDGPGIGQEILPRVFDAHITTKPGGEGLGLATVKAIVESHGGTIQLESNERGTRFEIAFPMAE